MQNKAVLVAMQHMSTLELDIFRANIISKVKETTKDHLKTKKENPGVKLYELHHPKWNIARRRKDKSPYFSSMA